MKDILGIIEHKRLYVLVSILYALEDPSFKMTYFYANSSEELALQLFQAVERKIKGSDISERELIIDELRPVLQNLGAGTKHGTKQSYPNGALHELISKIDALLFEYHQNSQIDLTSIFFNVFLHYSTSGGSDLGIVLTPAHICNLFCDLANISENSRVLDICAGTGGFLTSALKRIMLDDDIGFSTKEKFRTSNIYGIEKDPTVFTIVALNMFINRDGKSQLQLGDAFNLKENIKKLDCTVGFLNPPFSDSIYSEISFVELMLDVLLPDSIGVAVVPVNASSSRTKLHPDGTMVKRRILEKHCLIASIQMPTNLFYPKGVETVVLVFRTGKVHRGETWIARYDDGYELIKHQKARTPTSSCPEIHESFIESYKNKRTTEYSFSKSLTYKDQWIYTLHEEVNYTIDKISLQETLNEYLSYLYMNHYC